MKLRYWNMYTTQIPLLWTGEDTGSGVIKTYKPEHTIRVIGHQHTLSCLRWLFQIAYENPGYTFMVFSDNVDSFRDLSFPDNVIPVLQVANRRAYVANIRSYLDLCQEREVALPTLSIFCNDIVNVTKDIKWLLLSGLNMRNIYGTIRDNRPRIPIYVESFKYSKRLPDAINLRCAPTMNNMPIEAVVKDSAHVTNIAV